MTKQHDGTGASLALFPGCDPFGILFGSLGAVERGLIAPHDVVIAWMLSLEPAVDPRAAAGAAVEVAQQKPARGGCVRLLDLLSEVSRCPAPGRRGGRVGLRSRSAVRRRRARANLVIDRL